jgi:hypothetical protein
MSKCHICFIYASFSTFDYFPELNERLASFTEEEREQFEKSYGILEAQNNVQSSLEKIGKLLEEMGEEGDNEELIAYQAELSEVIYSIFLLYFLI